MTRVTCTHSPLGLGSPCACGTHAPDAPSHVGVTLSPHPTPRRVLGQHVEVAEAVHLWALCGGPFGAWTPISNRTNNLVCQLLGEAGLWGWGRVSGGEATFLETRALSLPNPMRPEPQVLTPEP